MTQWAQFVANGLVSGAAFAGITNGFFFLRQANGFVDLTFAAGYLAAGYMAVHLSGSVGVALCAALGVTAATLGGFRKITRLSGHGSGLDLGRTLAGAGVAVLATGAALLIAGPGHVFSRPPQFSGSTELPGGVILVTTQMLVLAWGLFTVAVSAAVYYTPWSAGIYLRAHGESPTDATEIGLPVQRIEGVCVAMAAVSVAGAAAFATWDVGVEPETGLRVGVYALLASHLAGGRTPLTCALGGFVFGFLQEIVAFQVNAAWKEGAALASIVALGALVSLRNFWQNKHLCGGSE